MRRNCKCSNIEYVINIYLYYSRVTEDITVRRLQLNRTYFSLLLGILLTVYSLGGFNLETINSTFYNVGSVVFSFHMRFFLLAFGLIICCMWLWHIISIRKLLKARFAVICYLESYISNQIKAPIAVYSLEYQQDIGSGKTLKDKKIWQSTIVEVGLSIVFALAFLTLLCAEIFTCLIL